MGLTPTGRLFDSADHLNVPELLEQIAKARLYLFDRGDVGEAATPQLGGLALGANGLRVGATPELVGHRTLGNELVITNIFQ